jgi:LmbE family N-acetylglucosaminyl deacetylase
VNAGAARAAIEALPLCDFPTLFGDGSILVLAPHPDDESLGCGGLIAEACATGRRIEVAILTDGSMSHPNSRAWPAERLAAQRRDEARAAMAILGLPEDRLHFLDQPDSAAAHDGPRFEAVLERLCGIMRAAEVGTLCAAWIGDPHGDHGAAAKLAAAACARLGARHLAYPIWAWMVPDDGTLPDVAGGGRLDVRRHLPAKRRAIAAHASQYTSLIDDDPDGFRLPPEFLAMFDRPWEAFLEQK